MKYAATDIIAFSDLLFTKWERVKTTSAVYECTKYSVYEKVIIELKNH